MRVLHFFKSVQWKHISRQNKLFKRALSINTLLLKTQGKITRQSQMISHQSNSSSIVLSCFLKLLYWEECERLCIRWTDITCLWLACDLKVCEHVINKIKLDKIRSTSCLLYLHHFCILHWEVWEILSSLTYETKMRSEMTWKKIHSLAICHML